MSAVTNAIEARQPIVITGDRLAVDDARRAMRSVASDFA